jgi:hypothetical protein
LFDDWIRSLEARHLANLEFAEVSRALRALSSTYVERRPTIAAGAALSGAGKRAAFALFYGPLHFLIVREIVNALPGAAETPSTLVDLGCGTGAAGAAWGSTCRARPAVIGIDKHPWALREAAETYRAFGLTSRTRLQNIGAMKLPGARSAVLAAFALNEVSDEARDAMRPRLVHAASRGHSILIVEPLARSVAPWWKSWQAAFTAAGGRADEWRFRVELPPIVAKLDRAAGLNHHEITARSLWIAG